MNVATATFTDVVRDVSGGNPKVPQSAFLKAGAIPVVDQGQSFVAGYTHDEDSKFRSTELPVIVFGDHTKAVKFIDFPFAMGADGIKVLKPVDGCDIKYLYHFLRYSKLPDAGYSRHYKFVKELEVPLPPLPEQRRIATILDKADALRAKRRDVIAKLDQLLQSVFLDMFGDPVSNSRGLPVATLEEVSDRSDRINYGVVQPGQEFSGGVPLVRISNIEGGKLDVASIKKIDPKVESGYVRSRLKGNELLISCVGSIGTVATVPKEAIGFNIARAITRVPFKNPKQRAFVQSCLRSQGVQRYFQEKTRIVSQPTLNVEFVKQTQIVLPPVEEQELFACTAERIEQQTNRMLEGMNYLDTLFASLQHRAFSGTL